MKFKYLPLARLIPMLAMVALVSTPFFAHADDYSDISQLIRSGKYSEATSKIDQLLLTKPKDAQLRFLKGTALQDSAKSNEAISTFTNLIEDYPELPEPYNNLAVLYAEQGKYEKARGALEMAIRVHPDYALAQENLGDVYAKLALQAYSKAAQLDSANKIAETKATKIHQLLTSAAPGKRK